MKRFFTIFFLLALLITVWPSLLVKAETTNTATDYFFTGAKEISTEIGYTTSATDDSNLLLTRISLIINFILSLLGVLFLVLILQSGFLWMTAAGNDKQVETAKNIVTRATIGLIIVLSAYAISFFIINRLL
jgi:hypothetical protein